MRPFVPQRSLPLMSNVRAAQVTSQEKLDFLRDPASYGEGGAVEAIETHFAWVFLTAHFAYKMKKSMRQDSMDYRTLRSREAGCRNELRLNRRLAPSVYLDVVPLVIRADRTLALGAHGRPVDWLVKMRRLPADRMLDQVLSGGAVRAAESAAVIGMLADFYRGARRMPCSPQDYLANLRMRVAANSRALMQRGLGLDRACIARVIHAQLEFIERHAAVLGARSSYLVEAHGDLRPEHIFLGSVSEPVSVIDCLEFDEGLRCFDPAEEVAFLALECLRLGGARLAQELLRGVPAATGDSIAESVSCFYTSQRAATRAKLAVWHLRDPALVRRQAHWRDRAEEYLHYAASFARLAADLACAPQTAMSCPGLATDPTKAPAGNRSACASVPSQTGARSKAL